MFPSPARLAPALLLVLGVAAVPAADPPAGPDVAAALKPFVEKHKLAGAVALVADKDKVLTVDAVGLADLKAKQPMKADAVFWVASMTKPMTAVAVMMLVDEGKVKLDDPVAKYLPEFKDLWVAVEKDDAHMLLRRPKRAVTVRDLLTHTSGFPQRMGVDTPPPYDTVPLRDRVRSYPLTPLGTEPGTAYLYSNPGINTAGRIVEVVGGRPYEEFMDARLFGPLGMTDTTFWPSDGQVKRLARAYKWNTDETGLDEATVPQLSHPLTDRKRYPLPSGGLFSTAADCGTFCRMVLNGGALNGKRYLSEAAVKEMTRRQTPEAVKGSYGLGWMVGNGFFGHGGAYGTNMSIDPERGLVTVFMVQHAGPGGGMRDAQAAFRAAAQKAFDRSKK